MVDFEKFRNEAVNFYRRNEDAILKGGGIILISLLCAKLKIPYPSGIDSSNRSYVPRYDNFVGLGLPQNSVESAIRALVDASETTNSEYYKVGYAEKIENIVCNSLVLDDQTREYAITALTKIMNSMKSDYYRSQVVDLIESIVE